MGEIPRLEYDGVDIWLGVLLRICLGGASVGGELLRLNYLVVDSLFLTQLWKRC